MLISCSFYSQFGALIEFMGGNDRNATTWEYHLAGKYHDFVIKYLNGFFSDLATMSYKELIKNNFLLVEEDAWYGCPEEAKEFQEWLKRELGMVDDEEIRRIISLVFCDSNDSLSLPLRYGAYHLVHHLGEDNALYFQATIEPNYIPMPRNTTFFSKRDYILDNARNETEAFEKMCGLLWEDDAYLPGYEDPYWFPSLKDILHCLVSKMISQNCNLKRCPNCGRYFVPETRSNTKYCSNISPQDPLKTCQEYRKYMNYLIKTQTDEATKLYKQIYNALANKTRRCAGVGGNEVLKSTLSKLSEASKQWKVDVKAGTKAEAEYIDWLKAVKEKKVL